MVYEEANVAMSDPTRRSDARHVSGGTNSSSDQIAHLAEAFHTRLKTTENNARHAELLVDDAFQLSLRLLDHAFTMARRAHGVCEELQAVSSGSADDSAVLQRTLDSLSALLYDVGVGCSDARGSSANREDPSVVATHDVTMCILDPPKGESNPPESERHDRHMLVNCSEPVQQENGHAGFSVRSNEPRVSLLVARIVQLTQRSRAAAARIFDAIRHRSDRRRVRAA